ncbi:hypothetical protein GCM10011588_51400 [Nocardia jinanensis]|uniref:Uncharacterized protein n=1 Tax=Nocardia jinanensis TaxID=382504 RepID=A0A917RUJ1_9NOCA|nr:hypothetical protein GCM10011588_51400 [Nocardia jinanensis]
MDIGSLIPRPSVHAVPVQRTPLTAAPPFRAAASGHSYLNRRGTDEPIDLITQFGV